jgi:hypothetical protein
VKIAFLRKLKKLVWDVCIQDDSSLHTVTKRFALFLYVSYSVTSETVFLKQDMETSVSSVTGGCNIGPATKLCIFRILECLFVLTAM